MLVLKRQVDDRVLIDVSKLPVDERGMICVTVTRIIGNAVKLGFDAPACVPIYRGELFTDDTQMENEG